MCIFYGVYCIFSSIQSHWFANLHKNGCRNLALHYNDVTMSAMASQITSLTIVYSTVIQLQIKESIKAPRDWPLWGEFARDRWIPRTKCQWRGNVSIWWRHHDLVAGQVLKHWIGFSTVQCPNVIVSLVLAYFHIREPLIFLYTVKLQMSSKRISK